MVMKLKKQNIHFSFSFGSNDINIDIPNLQDFINEMEIIQNSKKYNL